MKSMSLTVVVLLLLGSQAFAADVMPEGVRKTIENNFIGKWGTTITYDGATVKGDYEAKWSKGKHCVIIEDKSASLSGEGDDHGAGVLAWDPVAKAVVHHGFLSNGDNFTVKYTKVSGDKWSGKIVQVFDGTKDESECSVDWKADSWVYKDKTHGKPFIYTAVRR